MKTIIYLISSLKDDGPNRVLKSMIDGIDRKQYKVIVVSFLKNSKKYVDMISKKTNRVYELGYDKKIHIITKSRKDLLKIIHDNNPDIIHSHGLLPDIAIARIRTKTKKITTIHDNMFEDYLYRFGGIKGRLFTRLHIHFLKRMDKCVCCSSSSYSNLASHLNNVTYVRNAIFDKKIEHKKYTTNRKNIRKKYHINNSDTVYIYAGSISKLKNVFGLIDNFNHYLGENEYLFIMGSGPIESQAIERIKNKNIIYLGYVNDVIKYMCASDVYVSFSKSEGFSISILEALETDNYLLLNNIPSHAEVLKIDPNIYIGEMFSTDFLRKKKQLSQRIKNNNHDHSLLLERHLNIHTMMKLYESIYNDCDINNGGIK